MSTNGSLPSSPTGSISEQSKILSELRLSADIERSSSPVPAINGHSPLKQNDVNDKDLDVVSRLQNELERTKEEKEQLASQYRNLLSKLTTMRTTLGNKLKQDAVCTLLFHVSSYLLFL